MRRLAMLLALVVAALWFGAGQAAAEESSGASQDAGQSASSGQGAGAGGGAYQAGATNSAMNIRVLSPGNNGAVTQSNTTTAAGVAANSNTTDQSVGQSQTGGHGSDDAQIAGQSAKNDQSASADATAVQLAPSNSATSIRVLSPGNDGDVTQSNAATAGAVAANDNDTTQSIDQSQTGGGSGSDNTQIAGQDSASRQSADADATAVQIKPSNEALSTRVLSPGNDGDVNQSNSATAIGIALNDNETTQSLDQSQMGGSPAYSENKGKGYGKGYGKGADYAQIAGQSASNRQSADADAVAVQVKPSNESSSIRVLSPGNEGDVKQSNSTTAIAAAKNDNDTTQSIDQDQTGRGGSGDYLQVAGQGSWSLQSAEAGALAFQLGASNENAPVRVGSPGGGGSVRQANTVVALAAALNGNATSQSLMQTQSGYGSDSLQVAGQGSWNEQRAGALALALQVSLKPMKKRR